MLVDILNGQKKPGSRRAQALKYFKALHLVETLGKTVLPKGANRRCSGTWKLTQKLARRDLQPDAGARAAHAASSSMTMERSGAEVVTTVAAPAADTQAAFPTIRSWDNGHN